MYCRWNGSESLNNRLQAPSNYTILTFFQESYRQVMKMRPKDLWKRLMIKFRGEEGLDYGGVAR